MGIIPCYYLQGAPATLIPIWVLQAMHYEVRFTVTRDGRPEVTLKREFSTEFVFARQLLGKMTVIVDEFQGVTFHPLTLAQLDDNYSAYRSVADSPLETTLVDLPADKLCC